MTARTSRGVWRARRRRATGLSGLLAMAVHLAAYALAATMPVATALAAAEASPTEIVICTVHGPVRVDRAELGLDGVDASGSLPGVPLERTVCDLALHAAAFSADLADAPPAAAPPLSASVPACCVLPMEVAHAAPDIRAQAPRAPPLS